MVTKQLICLFSLLHLLSCLYDLGVFHHIAKNHISASPRTPFSQNPSSTLPSIAESYLKELVDAQPGTISSGMVRVDLMIHNDVIVVNEFESLEAMYSTPSDRSSDLSNEAETFQFMVNFWIDMIKTRVIEPELLRI